MKENLDSKSVLVLGSGDRAGLEVVRSLGRSGMLVDSIYFEEPGLCEKSSFINASFYFGNPTKDLLSFSVALKKHLICKDYDLLFPINDLAHQILYYSYEEFSDLVSLAMPEPEVFRFAHDKVETFKLCRRLGIPVPDSKIVGNLEELGEMDFTGGKYLKPESSVRIQDGQVVKSRVRKVDSPLSAEDFYRDFCAECRVLVQEVIDGVGLGVNILAIQGEVIAVTVTERLHEPVNGGAGSYRFSKPISEVLRVYADEIARATSWNGLAMLEFKRNGSDYYLMEINGRAWGSIGLSIFSGVDFPKLYAEHLLLGSSNFALNYSTGRFTRNLVMDTKWAKNKMLRLQVIELAQSAVVGCVRLAMGREKVDEFDRHDFFPLIAAVGGLVTEILNSFKRILLNRLSRGGLMMRRCGATQVLGRSSSVGNVLFVCKGNINRSAFAAAYLEQQYGITCDSAGTLLRRRRLASRQAVKVAGKFGVDLSLHQSSFVGDKAINEYSSVVVFDHQNMSALLSEYPECRHKIFFLSSTPIHDPFGHCDLVFNTIFQQIKQALDGAYR